MGRRDASLVRFVAGGSLTLGALFLGSLLAAGDDVATHLGEEDAGVEDGEEGTADEDERAVENKKAGLVLHDVVAPTASHFGDTDDLLAACLYMYIYTLRAEEDLPVNATDKDGHVRRANGHGKDAKLGAAPDGQALGALGLGLAHPARDAEEVVEAEGAKGGEDDNLQGDAGNDGLVARLLQLGLVVACGGRDAAADGLDDEAGDVGGEEDARVPGGGDAGEGRVEGEGDVLEGEVDGDADEGRAQDDGADLELKGALVPGIRGEEDATDVAWGMLGHAERIMVWREVTHLLFLISGRR